MALAENTHQTADNALTTGLVLVGLVSNNAILPSNTAVKFKKRLFLPDQNGILEKSSESRLVHNGLILGLRVLSFLDQIDLIWL